MATSSATKISQLYVSLFGRAPDSAGLAFWTEALDGGSWTFASIAKSMFDTAPARAYYPAGASAETVVTTFYTNVLGRAPDAEGLAFWVKEYTAAGKDQGAFFAKLITNVVEYKGTDAAGLKSQNLFTNKVTVAEFYGNNNGTIAGATAALAGVTDVASTVDTAKTAILNPVVAGQTFTLSTTTDTIIGTAGNDTISGVLASTGSTITTGDRIVDGSAKDNDTVNLTLNAGLSSDPTITGIENVNLTVASATAVTSTAANLSGVNNLTVTMTDPVIGGTSIAGNKAVTVSNLDATKVLKVTSGAGTTDLSVTQVTKAGVTVDGATATGNVDLTGAGTLTANAATGTVTATPINTARSASFVENTKALTINAGAAAGNVLVQASVGSYSYAGPITVNADTTKSVIINNVLDAKTATNAVSAPVVVNAAKAETLTVDDATWGATVVAGTAHAANATISVQKISSSGASITTGTGSTTNSMTIRLGGTAATTDAASVSAAGTVALDVGYTTSVVDAVTLSGNGATATYTITATNGTAPTSITATGSQLVNVSANDVIVNGKTVTGVNLLKLTAHTSGNVDLSKVTNTGIELNADLGGTNTLTLANTANVTVSANQTTAFNVVTSNAGDAITLTMGDTNGASNTAVPTFTTGTLDLSAMTGTSTAAGTATIDATIAKVSLTTTKANTNVNLIVKGTKDVDLGGVTAGKTLDASALTGKLTATFAADDSPRTITSGSGADVLTINRAFAYTVNAGDGVNDIVLTKAAANTVVITGSGDDLIENLGSSDSAGTMVITTGAGNDEVRLVGASDAIVSFGDGTADQLTVSADADESAYSSGAYTFTNFALTGVEKVEIANTKTLTLSATQFAKDNAFALTSASSGNGTLAIVGNLSGASSGTGVASVIDASGVTRVAGSTALVTITGSSKADTITGSGGADTIKATAGADSIDGGVGTDKYDASNFGDLGGSSAVNVEGSTAGAQKAVVINLGSSAVANTTILAATGLYTADTVTSVAAGSVAYQYAASGSTNSAVVQSLASIESVVGTSGKDYIVAASSGTTIDAGAGNDYVLGGASDDTITGGAGDDTLIGGAGGDTFLIDAASGADSIYFGAGSGTLTDAATDILKFNFTTVASLAVTTALKTVYGFEAGSGNDVIQFAQGLLVNGAAGTGTGTGGYATITAGSFSTINHFQTLATNKMIIEIAGTSDVAAGSGNIATLAWSAIAGNTTATTAVNNITVEKMLFAVSDGTDTFVWYFNSADTTAEAADITLIGVIKSVTALASGDITIV